MAYRIERLDGTTDGLGDAVEFATEAEAWQHAENAFAGDSASTPENGVRAWLRVIPATPRERAEACIASLGLTMTAVFVPQSQSRNKGDRTPSLNWRVTIAKAGTSATLTTDYMQGIGHLPKYTGRERLYPHAKMERERDAAEHGKVCATLMPSGHWYGAKPVPPPTIADVLHCLVSDADAIDYATFEEWADCFGYETDSRSGEATYRACLTIALQLRSMVGDAGLAALREAFQDY